MVVGHRAPRGLIEPPSAGDPSAPGTGARSPQGGRQSKRSLRKHRLRGTIRRDNPLGCQTGAATYVETRTLCPSASEEPDPKAARVGFRRARHAAQPAPRTGPVQWVSKISTSATPVDPPAPATSAV